MKKQIVIGLGISKAVILSCLCIWGGFGMSHIQVPTAHAAGDCHQQKQTQDKNDHCPFCEHGHHLPQPERITHNFQSQKSPPKVWVNNPRNLLSCEEIILFADNQSPLPGDAHNLFDLALRIRSVVLII